MSQDRSHLPPSLLDRHPRPRSLPAGAADLPAQPAAAAPDGAACRPPAPRKPTPITDTGSNGDEDRYDKTYIGNFHKGLTHNEFGEVHQKDYEKLLKILADRKGFDRIPLALRGPNGKPPGRAMVNPQAGLATDVEGPDPKTLEILAAPRVDSPEAAAEAVELYWMALLRDVPFREFESSTEVADAAAEMSKLDDFTGPLDPDGKKVTPRTVFRGHTAGDLAGPYLSQFLLHPIPYGSLTLSQKQLTVVPGRDYLTDFGAWLEVQNGRTAPDDATEDFRYIRTMRDLGRYVHVDALYEAYLNACLILLGSGAALDPGNPYAPGRPDQNTQDGFGTFGGPHVLSLVTEVATRALKAVWWQKWFVHRRLRPEAYGGLIHVCLEGVDGTKRSYPIARQVLDSDALDRSRARFGSFLLPMAFPEGSPMHPAYGAGHATVAGACVTILKAFFDDRAPLPLEPKVANAGGTVLDSYLGPDAGSLTVGGELDKLAANISIGRNMAGVHWRSDYTESVRLGEKVALSILHKQRCDYAEKDRSFSLCTFDGRRVTVDANGVEDEKGNPVDLP